MPSHRPHLKATVSQALLFDMPIIGDDNDERYTLPETLRWCKVVTGVAHYDLDVAACRESHMAERWLSKTENGLITPWVGHVWCNPPYSDIESWVECAWRQIRRDEVISISMLLPANRAEQPWWQGLVEPYREGRGTFHRLTTSYLPGRTKFGHPGNPGGVGVGSPPFGCVLLVWLKS